MDAPSGLRCHGGGPEPLCRSGELQARSGAKGVADFSATHVKESSNLPKLYIDSSFQTLSYVRLPERLIWSPKVAAFAGLEPSMARVAALSLAAVTARIGRTVGQALVEPRVGVSPCGRCRSSGRRCRRRRIAGISCRERRTLVGERVRQDLKVLTTLRTC